jgi:hypothetical protein
MGTKELGGTITFAGWHRRPIFLIGCGGAEEFAASVILDPKQVAGRAGCGRAYATDYN